jgi:hypothetical protein
LAADFLASALATGRPISAAELDVITNTVCQPSEVTR